MDCPALPTDLLPSPPVSYHSLGPPGPTPLRPSSNEVSLTLLPPSVLCRTNQVLICLRGALQVSLPIIVYYHFVLHLSSWWALGSFGAEPVSHIHSAFPCLAYSRCLIRVFSPGVFMGFLGAQRCVLSSPLCAAHKAAIFCGVFKYFPLFWVF